jgi:hypothetical protein
MDIHSVNTSVNGYLFRIVHNSYQNTLKMTLRQFDNSTIGQIRKGAFWFDNPNTPFY